MSKVSVSQLVQETLGNIGSQSNDAMIASALDEGIGDTIARGYRKVTGQETLGDRTQDAKDYITKKAGQAGDKLKEMGASAKQAIEDNPKMAAGAAGAAGLIGAGVAARKYMKSRKNK